MPQQTTDAADAKHSPARGRPVVALIAMALLGRRGRHALLDLWRSSGWTFGERREVFPAVLRLTAALPGESAGVLRAVGEIAAQFGLGDHDYRRLIEESSIAARSGVDAASIINRIHATALLAEVNANVKLEPVAPPAA